MKRDNILRVPLLILSFLCVALILAMTSCQYDYNSPGPGVIDVRLKTISSPQNITFSPLNNFVLTVTTVEAIRSDNERLSVYGDLKSFSRTASVFNTLDTLARDSARILGVAYAPPAQYVGIDILLQPGDFVTLDGYRSIRVDLPDDFNSTLHFDKNFEVTSGKTTRITLTINLDSTLQKQADNYNFVPYYYISSILYE